MDEEEVKEQASADSPLTRHLLRSGALRTKVVAKAADAEGNSTSSSTSTAYRERTPHFNRSPDALIYTAVTITTTTVLPHLLNPCRRRVRRGRL